MEANLWQNVPNVEKKWLPRKLGRWLANLTKRERKQNLQSVCASAAAKPSEQYSTNRKSDLLSYKKQLFLYFLFNKL